MADFKEIKKPSNKREEFKMPSPESEREEPPREITIIRGMLSQYNTKIRTSKTIEITGTGRSKLPNLGSVPSTCQVGELIVSGGKLYICSAADTFTIVGTQT